MSHCVCITLSKVGLYAIFKRILPRSRKIPYDRPIGAHRIPYVRPKGINRVLYVRPKGVLPVKLVSQPLILFLVLLLDFHFQGFFKRKPWF